MRRARFAALLPPIIEWLSAVGIATVFGLGCWQVIIGQLSIGWFIGYIAMVGLMFKPIKDDWQRQRRFTAVSRLCRADFLSPRLRTGDAEQKCYT